MRRVVRKLTFAMQGILLAPLMVTVVGCRASTSIHPLGHQTQAA
jgi:hypothetical protein